MDEELRRLERAAADACPDVVRWINAKLRTLGVDRPRLGSIFSGVTTLVPFQQWQHAYTPRIFEPSRDIWIHGLTIDITEPGLSAPRASAIQLTMVRVLNMSSNRYVFPEPLPLKMFVTPIGHPPTEPVFWFDQPEFLPPASDLLLEFTNGINSTIDLAWTLYGQSVPRKGTTSD